MIKEIARRRSKLGKMIDDTDYSQAKIAKFINVEQETISRWATLNNRGLPKQSITTGHLQKLVMFFKEKCNMIIDPSDLLEEPDYYINKVTIVGEVKQNAVDVIPFSKQKQETFETKYAPDCYAIVFKRNVNKSYYFVFEDVERNPLSSTIHGADVLLKLKNGKLLLGMDMEIYGEKFRYNSLIDTGNKKSIHTLPKNKVEYFSLMTDVNIVIEK